MGIDNLDRSAHFRERWSLHLHQAQLASARADIQRKRTLQIMRAIVTAFHNRTGGAILFAALLLVQPTFLESLNCSDIAALGRFERELLQLSAASRRGFSRIRAAREFQAGKKTASLLVKRAKRGIHFSKRRERLKQLCP